MLMMGQICKKKKQQQQLNAFSTLVFFIRIMRTNRDKKSRASYKNSHSRYLMVGRNQYSIQEGVELCRNGAMNHDTPRQISWYVFR